MAGTSLQVQVPERRPQRERVDIERRVGDVGGTTPGDELLVIESEAESGRTVSGKGPNISFESKGRAKRNAKNELPRCNVDRSSAAVLSLRTNGAGEARFHLPASVRLEDTNFATVTRNLFARF